MLLPVNFAHFSDKQKVALLICVAIIFLGGGIGVATLRKAPLSPPSSTFPIQPPITAQPNQTPASFSFVPAEKTLKAGEPLSLSLSLSTGDFTVDAVDLILTYDPEILKVEKVTEGEIFTQYPIRQTDNEKGRVQLSAAAGLTEGKVTGFSGQGQYGVIVFRALKETPEGTAITINSNSIAASAGKNKLDLDNSPGGRYIITR